MPENEISLSEKREFIVSLMPQAGEILRGHFNLNTLSSTLKNPRDLVTQADLDADKFLRESIEQRFPGAKFLTEETAPENYFHLRDEDNLWVIDSLDGSWNLFKGDPNFAISVALVSHAVTRMGVVFVLMSNKYYWAQEDLERTFLNGKPVRGISKIGNLERAVFGVDWVANEKDRERTFEFFRKIFNQVGPIKSMGSAVADLSSLTEGKIDAYLNCGLKPWDVAATSLFVKKEGGIITTPEGKPWNIFEPDVFASNRLLHLQCIKLFNQK